MSIDMETKRRALKMLLAGKPVKDAFPLIRIVLLPTKEVRPNLFPFVTGCTSHDISMEVQKRFCRRPVIVGKEKSYEQYVIDAYPNYNVEVGYGMNAMEYDNIIEKFEKEYL